MEHKDTAAPARYSWFHLVLPFAVGYYLSYLLRNANAVISPVLAHELKLDAADLGLLTGTYFLAFGAFQIPLGMLLDRYGPRRVESTLMLFTAAGTLLFALGHNIAELAVARGIIGLGVSACLMAALKNLTQWYPADRQASLASVIMVAGGLGAVSASAPLEAMLPIFGWRGIFFALTLITVLVAAFLFFGAKDHQHGVSRTSFALQWAGVTHILTSRQFWRFAPQTALFSGGFMAIQGLWAVPWFMNVDGHTRDAAANYLFANSTAMLASYLFASFFATSLIRRGLTSATLLGTSLTAGWVCELMIVIGIHPSLPLWIGFGFFLSAAQFAYTALAERFPVALSGRVSTALNLMAFAGAFSLQWGFGVIVETLTRAGWPAADGYRVAFGIMIALQAATWAWFMLDGRREHVRKRNSSVTISPVP